MQVTSSLEAQSESVPSKAAVIAWDIDEAVARRLAGDNRPMLDILQETRDEKGDAMNGETGTCQVDPRCSKGIVELCVYVVDQNDYRQCEKQGCSEHIGICGGCGEPFCNVPLDGAEKSHLELHRESCKAVA